MIKNKDSYLPRFPIEKAVIINVLGHTVKSYNENSRKCLDGVKQEMKELAQKTLKADPEMKSFDYFKSDIYSNIEALIERKYEETLVKLNDHILCKAEYIDFEHPDCYEQIDNDFKALSDKFYDESKAKGVESGEKEKEITVDKFMEKRLTLVKSIVKSCLEVIKKDLISNIPGKITVFFIKGICNEISRTLSNKFGVENLTEDNKNTKKREQLNQEIGALRECMEIARKFKQNRYI